MPTKRWEKSVKSVNEFSVSAVESQNVKSIRCHSSHRLHYWVTAGHCVHRGPNRSAVAADDRQFTDLTIVETQSKPELEAEFANILEPIIHRSIYTVSVLTIEMLTEHSLNSCFAASLSSAMLLPEWDLSVRFGYQLLDAGQATPRPLQWWHFLELLHTTRPAHQYYRHRRCLHSRARSRTRYSQTYRLT